MISMRSATRHLKKALGASVLLVLAACSGGGNLSTPELLSRAEAAARDGEYRAALIDLRNAVAKEPENAQARFQLGTAALLLGDPATAEKELRRARELGFEDDEALIEPMAEALISLGRGREALAELRAADESSAAVLALIGAAQQASGSPDMALRAYRRALEIDPEQERALLGTARFAVAKGDWGQVESLYETTLEAHPESPLVYLDYGRYRYLRGQPDAAETLLTKGLSLPIAEQRLPLRWELQVSQAEALLAQSKLEQAQATVDSLNDIQPDHVLVTYLRGRIAFEREDLALASELVGRVLVQVPQFEAAQMLQATIHLARGEYTQARLLLDPLAARNPNDAQVRKLLAAATLGTTPGEADSPSPDGVDPAEVLALLGNANAETGDFGTAVALWERALQDDPSDEGTRLELTTAYLLGQRTEQAQALIDGGDWTTPENAERAAMLDALLSMRSADMGAARRKLDVATAQFPESAALISMQGLAVMRQDQNLATSYFRRALEIDPSHTTSMVNLASIAIANGDVDRGTALLRSFIDDNPKDAVALNALAQQQQRSGDVDGARVTLERARAADPQAVPPRLQLMELTARLGEFVTTEEIAREVVALRPTSSAAHNGLGIALMGQSRFEEGVQSMRTSVRLDPTGLEPLRNLARAEFATNDRAQAQATVEQLLRNHPNDTVGLEIGARVALAEGRVDEAEALLATLVETDPVGARLINVFLRGDIAMARGQHQDALAHYEEAAKEQRNSALTIRLYQARRAVGDASAVDALDDWLTEYPDDGQVLMVRAQHAQANDDTATAAATYERLIQANPSNVVAWNNLAWVYSAAGDGRALEAAKSALDLAAGNPMIQDTYGWMLVLDGQLDNGISLLRDAWESAPSLGDIGYHLAAGLARAGETDEARNVLAKALDGGDFPTRSEAERLMGDL